MRKIMTLALASTAVVAVACGKDKTPSTAMSADLQRDLKLASATQDIRINPDEIAPTSKPTQTVKPKRAPQGPKVVRTETPTKLASAAPTEAAEIPTDIPEVQAMAPAPTPEMTPDAAPPLARPSAIPASNNGGHGNGAGQADGGNGSGGVWGGVWGAVIRGGVVGDDDHCDPRRAPRNGRYPTSTDVYGGGIAGGGMIGRTLPTRGINPRGR